MPATVPVIATAFGFLLGAVCNRPTLQRTRTELAAARRRAEHDPLTGLPNRTGAQQYHQHRTAAGHPPAAALLDLDDFKSVNDTWGHHIGDAQLITVAQRLTAACPVGALASRLAGDEFLLLMPQTNPATVCALVSTILTQLSKPMTLPVPGASAITTTVHASAGIAMPEQGDTWSDLLHRADIALYHAKATSGHAVLHTPGMQQPPPTARRGSRIRDRQRDDHT